MTYRVQRTEVLTHTPPLKHAVVRDGKVIALFIDNNKASAYAMQARMAERRLK